jgi:hypothetical protein
VLYPILGNFTGACTGKTATPFVFGVTHENISNNHTGAANYDVRIVSYQKDFNYETDWNRWVGGEFNADGSLSLRLNTIDYLEKNSVTGWPLQYGKLFFGVNDLSISGATLDKDIFIDFDIAIPRRAVHNDLAPQYFSGHRILVGARATWTEPGRSNTKHFLEMDLLATPSYAASYGDPNRPACHDITTYDRCFYDPSGKFAEGRVVNYQSYYDTSRLFYTANYYHVQLFVSDLFKRLKWVAPPTAWSSAAITGTYVGIESSGTTDASVRIKNYRVYARQ